MMHYKFKIKTDYSGDQIFFIQFRSLATVQPHPSEPEVKILTDTIVANHSLTYYPICFQRNEEKIRKEVGFL